jgi:hypothetical protein
VRQINIITTSSGDDIVVIGLSVEAVVDVQECWGFKEANST